MMNVTDAITTAGSRWPSPVSIAVIRQVYIEEVYAPVHLILEVPNIRLDWAIRPIMMSIRWER